MVFITCGVLVFFGKPGFVLDTQKNRAFFFISPGPSEIGEQVGKCEIKSDKKS